MHVFCLSPYANHCAFLLSMGKGPGLAMGKVWVEKPFPQLSFFSLGHDCYKTLDKVYVGVQTFRRHNKY